MILFDGCSWTYGDQLENLHHRFSDLIGGVNIGECGKSNDGILRTTINYLERNTNIDTVIIQWTVNLRTEFRKPDAAAYDFIGRAAVDRATGYRQNLAKSYYKSIYNDNHALDNFYKNKFLMETYLQSKNLKYYMMTIDEEPEGLGSTWGSSYPENIRKLVGTHTVRDKGGHPNKEGHQLISDLIRSNIDSAIIA